MECFPEDTGLLKAKASMLQPQKNKGKEAREWGRKARLRKTERYQRSNSWSWPWERAGNLRAVHQVAKPHVEISKLEWEKSKAQLGKCLTTEAKEENTCAKCFNVLVRSSCLTDSNTRLGKHWAGPTAQFPYRLKSKSKQKINLNVSSICQRRCDLPMD